MKKSKSKGVITVSSSVISKREFNKILKECDPDGRLKECGIKMVFKSTEKTDGL